MHLPSHTNHTEESDIHIHNAVRHAAESRLDGEPRLIRVLILEDDPDTAEALALVLSLDEGFVVDIVGDVHTCIEHIQASSALVDSGQSHPFDVLLLDMLLRTGHKGTEVIDAAAAIPHLNLPPMIVCTALSGAALKAYAPGLNMNTVRILFKPFDIDDLMDQVRAAANHSEPQHVGARLMAATSDDQHIGRVLVSHG